MESVLSEDVVAALSRTGLVFDSLSSINMGVGISFGEEPEFTGRLSEIFVGPPLLCLEGDFKILRRGDSSVLLQSRFGASI